jgi:multisubunit Na+/H+ antiporter MnhC subunit
MKSFALVLGAIVFSALVAILVSLLWSISEQVGDRMVAHNARKAKR